MVLLARLDALQVVPALLALGLLAVGFDYCWDYIL